MLKKIVLVALLFLPLGIVAQDLKIAYVNTGEVYNAMPEMAAAETEFSKFSQSISTELRSMEEEYNRKMAEFQQQSDSLAQNIKVRRMQDLQDLRERTATFYETCQQDLAKKKEELTIPIMQKIQDAIKLVGDENGYSYIVNMIGEVFPYISPSATNATPLVKAKLGIKK